MISLRNKILSLPVCSLVFLVALVAIFLLTQRQQQNLLSDIDQRHLERTEQIVRSLHVLSQDFTRLKSLLMQSSGGFSDGSLDEERIYEEGSILLDEIQLVERHLLVAAAKFTDTSDQKALVSSIERELKNFRLKFISAIEMSTVDINLSARHVAEANDSYTKFTDAILELVDWAVRDSRAGVVKLNRIGERRSLVSIIVAIGLVAVLSGLTILVLPRIIGPVRRVTDVMHRLAEGDMTVTIPDK